MAKSTLDWIALILLIIGGLNWGLVAIDRTWDLVALIAGWTTGVIGTIIYALVGLSALYTIYYLFKD
jgi:uncharacterized membrane protein YuzA (DUF378 family)